MNDQDLLIDYAMSFVGTPYIWGGSGPEGYDCSGFVQEILMAAGADPPGDQTAQGLHDYFLGQSARHPPCPGALSFYGRTATEIVHVAFCVSEALVVEAGGGGSHTTVPTRGAFVRIRPIFARGDFVATFLPRYRLRMG